MRKIFLKEIQMHLERLDIHALLFAQHQIRRDKCLDILIDVKLSDGVPVPRRVPNNRNAALALALDRHGLVELRLEGGFDRARDERSGVEVVRPLAQSVGEENWRVLDKRDQDRGVDELAD